MSLVYSLYPRLFFLLVELVGRLPLMNEELAVETQDTTATGTFCICKCSPDEAPSYGLV